MKQNDIERMDLLKFIELKIANKLTSRDISSANMENWLYGKFAMSQMAGLTYEL
jgi:hypothetical protein